MKKKYKVPKRRQPFFSFIKFILRRFYRKPKLINLAGEIEDKCIIVSNHAAKNGPVALELYFPKFNVKWGAHEMLGNYKSRFMYLRDVYYIKKRGSSKFFASIMASFEAFFSYFFYKGLKFIGTYPDSRFSKTLKNSINVLDANCGVLIFPENSNEGYKEVLDEFYCGFVALSEMYYKRTGEDLPIYPTYYHLKKKILVVDKPIYVQNLKNDGLDRQAIADLFCNKVNSLFYNYVR